ncbi:Membrane-anchored ribosome-binding protein, inhibits growth in stationary phase, ElaB/YqjD/DUF883 family [Nitrosospira sp. Nsp14]|jgi:ElaB/YqjD/DUF883 family membrane-anchored ribosome-binding protein|uniref:DUF883 family protein n=1 Tax=Nitrosospira sp. Nsp14 TaxID=1855333 RepID=UPI0008E599A8|nr:DUF883 family protein [Nitrosospira sp. Nsp14]SFH49120.1 Membrane-anchored ribosome-binding protein, inhibits growth in stationary phase, ElaB/YqjD/DUF883 family [Nitrosospira sp. Nsp14]
MERDTSTNSADDAQAAAENVAHRVGSAAQRVGNAAKTAGKQVGAVASDELENLRADLDDLISRLPSLSDIDLEKAKDNLMQKIAETKETARDVAHDAREQLDHGIECSRDYVKERPLQSVGYAAAIGFLVGLLTSRR